MLQLLIVYLVFYAATLSVKVAEPSPPYEQAFQAQEEYTLPELPYKYNELEPYIDEETVKLRYSRHHAGYTAQLNYVLSVWRNSSVSKYACDI